MSKFFLPSQRVIVSLALYFMLLANFAFFSKLYAFCIDEGNYAIAISAPIAFYVFLLFKLNIFLLFFNNKGFKVLIVVLLLSAASAAYFMDTFSTIIDKDMIANLFQTDTKEALELITVKFILYIIVLGIIPSAIVLKSKIEFASYKKEFLSKALIALLSIIIFSVIYMIESKHYTPFLRNHKELTKYINPTYPINSFVRYLRINLKPQESMKPIAQDASRVTSDRKKLVVFVVGETARAANFSINSYDKETNPFMQNISNVVSLTNFYSCGTATAISLPCMFSKFPKDEYDNSKKSYENLVDVLNKSGVRVIWRDNNSGGSKGVAERLLDVKYFDGDSKNSRDEVLLEDLQQRVDLGYEDTFIVLHQEGSHGPTYYKRYPPQFEYFKPTCKTAELDKCTKEEIVNTYDNTILYTDYILKKSVDFLKNNEDKYDTLMVYVSDHGESLGENGIYLHGMPYLLAPEFQKHIPAIFYFGKNMQDDYARLLAKKDENFSHDNIFHTFLDIFNIKSSEYNKNLDLFSK